MKQQPATLADRQSDFEDTSQYIKSYMFIKGFAVGRELTQTLLALSVARNLHNGQYRKDGTPYIVHPLKVCSTLISYGIADDTTLAAALLHDVLEDCGERIPGGSEELENAYHIRPDVLHLIALLTKRSGLDDQQLEEYFTRIRSDPKAALIKLSDRLHNSSTLYTFTFPRMRKYIRETSLFILPMASYCKQYYPQYTNPFSILKNCIESMNRSMDVMLRKIEEILPSEPPAGHISAADGTGGPSSVPEQE